MLAAIPLGSCATMMASGATESPAVTETLGHAAFCDVAEPIAWSGGDTPETIVQVKEHNAVGKELCGWGHQSQSAGKTSP